MQMITEKLLSLIFPILPYLCLIILMILIFIPKNSRNNIFREFSSLAFSFYLVSRFQYHCLIILIIDIIKPKCISPKYATKISNIAVMINKPHIICLKLIILLIPFIILQLPIQALTYALLAILTYIDYENKNILMNIYSYWCLMNDITENKNTLSHFTNDVYSSIILSVIYYIMYIF